MKKMFPHKQVSKTVKCVICGKPIKARLVATKKPWNRTKCYKCWATVAKNGGSHDVKRQ